MTSAPPRPQTGQRPLAYAAMVPDGVEAVSALVRLKADVNSADVVRLRLCCARAAPC
jgi:hypothetical protein